MFVLKVAHHGALDGTNALLLDKLRHVAAPSRVAVICLFRNHRLPHPSTLTLLRESGFEVVNPVAEAAVPPEPQAPRTSQCAAPISR